MGLVLGNHAKFEFSVMSLKKGMKKGMVKSKRQHPEEFLMLGNSLWCLWLQDKKKTQYIGEAMILYQKTIEVINRKIVDNANANARERRTRVDSDDSSHRISSSNAKENENDTKILDEAIFNLAGINLILGETDKAIEAFEGLLKREELTPDEKADLFSNLSSAYVYKKDLARAKQMALTGIQLVPSHLKNLCTLGSIHNLLKEFDHAAEIYGLAVSYYDDSVESKIGLAHALHGRGKTELALTYLKEADVLDVGNPDKTAFKALCSVLREGGNEAEVVALKAQRELEDADRVRKRLLALAKSS